jgi:hypothetical protein
MKASSLIFLSIMMIAITSSCKKKSGSEINPVPADNYASIGAFHSTNGAQLQLFTVDGAGGGQFTAPKGTRVTVPANAFLTQAGGNVTGAVTIQFKEIYLKNDMLLSDMSLNAFWGPPIKSGGMFFLKAIQNNEALKLNTGKKLTIEQPLQGLSADTGMMAMVLMQRQDSTKQPGWVNADLDSLRITITGYIFGLYNFMSPADSGTWSNSDNPNFFTGPYTLLNLHPLDSVSVYHTEIFSL